MLTGEPSSNDKNDNGVLAELARQWEVALRQALMPVVQTAPVPGGGTPQTNITSGAAGARAGAAGGVAGGAGAGAAAAAAAAAAARHGSDNANKASVTATQDREQTKDIGQLYQIFPDEVLGSGQFGIVYGGVHRTTGHAVAIKVRMRVCKCVHSCQFSPLPGH